MSASRRGSVRMAQLYVVMAALSAPVAPARGDEPAATLDISRFALPRAPGGELHFEEPRDVAAVVIEVEGTLPETVGLSYKAQNWPDVKLERARDKVQPCQFGWTRSDDGLNGRWQPARVLVERRSDHEARITFERLTSEFPAQQDYDVTFRRTTGLKLDGVAPDAVRAIRVWTTSPARPVTVRVELNAGGTTPGGPLRFEGYNAHVLAVRPVGGCETSGEELRWGNAETPVFEIDILALDPELPYSGDIAHLRLIFPDDSFTIALPDLVEKGTIWFDGKSVFLKRPDDSTTAATYIGRCGQRKTISERVRSLPEQSYGSAYLGQPRPHAVAWSLGFKHARQRFWQDPNGDLTLEARTVRQLPAADTARYANGPGPDDGGNGRFFFGLEDWQVLGRAPDPAPALCETLRVRKDNIELEQTSVAAPLDGQVLDGPLTSDRNLVGLVRFRLTNVGPDRRTARLRLEYSSRSGRSPAPYPSGPGQDWKVPSSPRDPLSLDGSLVQSDWQGHSVLRARVETTMIGHGESPSLIFGQELEPGASCALLLKVPFVALDRPEEREALAALDFDTIRRLSAEFWMHEQAEGARIHTPVPQLDALHQSHLTYVQISDPAMPADPDLVNTSVGTSTYSNCGNESCMINEELDQRGLREDARRRLEVWVKYQGTEALAGRYTDHEGVFQGAGGYAFSAAYNQNHGWILWRLAEHYFYTRDKEWLERATPHLIAACDWITRQRQQTKQELPNSRGWEFGFLPPGGLEDVEEYRYWLTSNAMIWRGFDAAAAALEAVDHPEAARLRREADAYATDLRRGFETMRQHCPLVRLRDGRWVPYYPSRLYRRGRDIGWIRETLEGSLYLLLSGLYEPRGTEAQWILDDYQDNRYMSPPYGYALADQDSEWFDRGGISIQPNLLAGLLPHLDRDEIEVFLRMFFNSWVACYREEVNAMVEHPMPVLGYNNTAHPKTSDEANAVMWLRYLFVYGPRDGLYLGRALPRAWLAQAEPIGLENARTRWGKASVQFIADPTGDRIRARVDLDLHARPPKTLLRFRHPDRKTILSVTINGRAHDRFDPITEDVDLTDLVGPLEIEARFR